jgi:glutamate synthase domain-containing protein 2
MSKMGISAMQSYRGAQMFEAVGLRQDVVDKYFTWTPSRVGGIGLDVIAEGGAAAPPRRLPERAAKVTRCPAAGSTSGAPTARPISSTRGIDPQAAEGGPHRQLGHLQGVRELINDQSKSLYTLRGLLDFKVGTPIRSSPRSNPAEAIMKRFKTGAMSYGSISKEAHETLAIAMNRIGGKSNTGEGGEDPERYSPGPNGDSKNSAIKQVASGRFGVTSDYLVNAKELQIKMAQGAKPGEGGQLPGSKVYPWIAKTRHTTPASA